MLLRVTTPLRAAPLRRLPRPPRGCIAFLSTAQPPPPPPPRKKTWQEAKEDREPEYPFMLVNPRTRMGDAAPVFMVGALYLIYCLASSVIETVSPSPPPPPEPDEAAAAEELQACESTPSTTAPVSPIVLASPGAARRSCADEGRKHPSQSVHRRGRSLTWFSRRSQQKSCAA